MKNETGYDLVIQVLSAANVMVKESHRLFRPYGITDAQFNVLNVLGPQPQGMSQRELSDALVVDRSNITGLLDRMEKLGWVRRADHPTDRRVYLVTLTEEGRNLWQKVLPEYAAAVRRVTAVAPENELKRTLETLRRLEASAREWGRTNEA
ncbi:MAG TPA: MarR family transcriptional regulator [Lacunisphaera sp.]|nr:MarR family transcriptional regulator [Lacunisphaera sp.]